jgi:predicted CXXCH cytochrome family protein
VKRVLASVLAFLILGGCRSVPVQETASPSPLPTKLEFVGSERCQSCHEQEHQDWKESHHHQAMALPNEQTVLGDFDDSTFEYFGFRSKFYRRGEEYWVETDGPEGLRTEYKIEYTFGVAPLQQYLIRFPDGRLQALSICWDAEKKTWYHLFPEEEISSQSPLHWTAPQFNWNFMCAECHSTDVHKNYDERNDTYATTFSEISVSCESCHGPGSRHLDSLSGGEPSANGGFPVNLRGRGPWVTQTEYHPPKPENLGETSQQVETCARCHSRRSQISESYLHGQPLSQTHSVSALNEGLYHSDGQIDDEVYVYGSFVQSKMYDAGVVCTDCHDPHTARIKVKGDGLCLRCHLPQRYNTEDHTHHGNVSCVDCHMPGKLYMGVDFRRDHSLRIPRPDLSTKLGTPNACTACHKDKSVSWASTAYQKWYGDGPHHYGEALHSGRTGQPGRALDELVLDPAVPAIVRATAVSLSQDLVLLTSALGDPNELVRREAVRALQAAPAGTRQQLLPPLADDPILSVRVEVGRALADLKLNLPSVKKTVEEYRASLTLNLDRVESRLGMAELMLLEGDLEGAQSAYLKTLERFSRSPEAYLNLADFYRTVDKDKEGESVLRQGIATLPKSDTGYLQHALGLLLIRSRSSEAAVEHLKLATELVPLDNQLAFVYALALESVGQIEPAMEELKRVLDRRPQDPQILSALISFAEKANQPETAKKYRRALENSTSETQGP